MWSESPEKTIMQALGDRLRAHRKNRGWTQAELARRADIGEMTVKRLESEGQATVANLLRVLRELRLLDAVESALAPPAPSPLQQLREQRGK
jgi:transcriptional regulator with XRE-family HTH domain